MSQEDLVNAINRGMFNPVEGDLGFKYLDQVYVYETEEKTRRQYELASIDVYVYLVRFTNGNWILEEDSL